MTRLKKPIPTKQEIEADLQKLAELFDGYASRVESLWERRRDLAAIFKKSLLGFSKKSKPFLKKNILLLEIKLLERQLRKVENEIRYREKTGEKKHSKN